MLDPQLLIEAAGEPRVHLTPRSDPKMFPYAVGETKAQAAKE